MKFKNILRILSGSRFSETIILGFRLFNFRLLLLFQQLSCFDSPYNQIAKKCYSKNLRNYLKLFMACKNYQIFQDSKTTFEKIEAV